MEDTMTRKQGSAPAGRSEQQQRSNDSTKPPGDTVEFGFDRRPAETDSAEAQGEPEAEAGPSEEEEAHAAEVERRINAAAEEHGVAGAVAEGFAIVTEGLVDEIERLQKPAPGPAEEGPLPPDEEPVRFEPLPGPAILAHRTPPLMKAICRIMLELDQIPWDARNSQGNYQYASIDAFLAAVRPVMARNNVCLTTEQATTGVSSYRTSNGEVGLLDSTWEFTLVSAEDEGFIGPFPWRAVAPASMGAQAYGAVQSYAMKNFLRGQFLIATGQAGEDVDQTHGQPLGQRDKERNQPRQGATPPRQQAQPARAPSAGMPPQAPPPDDNDAPDRIPMRTRGESPPPRPPGAFETPLQKLKRRVKEIGESPGRVAAFYYHQSIDQLSASDITAALSMCDDIERERGRSPEAPPAGAAK